MPESAPSEGVEPKHSICGFVWVASSSKRLPNKLPRTSQFARASHFPSVNGLEVFEFGYQPSINKKELQQLAILSFIVHGENVVIPRPSGDVKAHSIVGTGLRLINAGPRAMFTTTANMIIVLTRTLADGDLGDTLKHYTVPRLLITDDD